MSAEVTPPPTTVDPTEAAFVEVKIDTDVPETSTRVRPKINFWREGFPPVLAAAVSRLTVVRLALLEILEEKVMKHRESRHDQFNVVATAKRRLEEEMERLEFLQRKVHEKNQTCDKATEELDRAKGMLALAKVEESNVNSAQGNQTTRSFTRICETLVQSWTVNVQSHEQSRAIWDFKLRRQTALVAEKGTEIQGTRAKYRSSCSVIDAQIAHLNAAVDLISRLE